MKMSVHPSKALIISRIDYCNSVHYGSYIFPLPLTAVLRYTAKHIKNLNPWDHVIPTLQELLQHPKQALISFKRCLLMYLTWSIQTLPLQTLPHLLHPVSVSNPDEDCVQDDFVAT